jgi:tryptophanyl-tRNA synthetase
VGEDQIQHLEITRDYCQRFNDLFIAPVNKDHAIPMPKVLLTESKRVMSLTDGHKKMSKSDKSKWSCLYFTDSPEVITDKIMKAKTDAISHVTLNENRVELSNLLKIYSWLSEKSLESTAKNFVDKPIKDFKKELAVVCAKEMSYISEKMDELLTDEEYLMGVLREGGLKANEIAEENIYNYKRLMGFLV